MFQQVILISLLLEVKVGQTKVIGEIGPDDSYPAIMASQQDLINLSSLKEQSLQLEEYLKYLNQMEIVHDLLFPPNQVTPYVGTRDCSEYFLIWPDGFNGIQVSHCFPLSAIGQLDILFEKGLKTQCTGAVIGPRLVLTAAHCFRPSILNFEVTNVLFTPGQFGTFKPFGTYNNGVPHVPDTFQKPFNLTDDFAVVEFQTNIGEKTGWLGIDYNECRYHTYNLHTAGYSYQKGNGDQMWISDCKNTKIDPCEKGGKSGLFLHLCDTFGGCSGSPMFQTNMIVGIHVSFDRDSIENEAVYISEQLIEFIEKYIDI
eukprot:TRINITY_DN4003_c0_g1_i1.p2 TRINITY_DN4003_c0_g1~~TRINITY_DN4003_c0_g1_i1.p2  ORF type:complete len:339 (-),score=18.51 TRINITY_DN4003_c0_g1_i1:340-1281(-)